MGVFSCDPDHSTEECGHQAAGENEGVSIFFGRSSIDTVKSLAEKRSNWIPKQFPDEVNATPSPGSVARKAAFFDQYIRTLSLEKASYRQEQEGDLESRQEDAGEESNHGSCIETGECMKMSRDEVGRGFVEAEAECKEAEEIEEMDCVPDVEVNDESDGKVDDMSFKESQGVETVEVKHEGEAAPSGAVNKWKSRNGLIPGARAAQKQAAGKASTVAAKKSVTPSKVSKGKVEASVSVVPKEKPASKPIASSGGFHFRSHERAEKRKEFNRKMEEKLSAREAEKWQQQAKTEEEKQAEIRELRRALNFKATPMPTFYHPPNSRKSTKDVKAKQQSSTSKKDSSRRQQQQQQQVVKSKAMMGKASPAIAVS